MSTKIYSGYLLPVTTLSGLFRWKKRVQTLFEAGCTERISLEIAKRGIRHIDNQLAAPALKLKVIPVKTHSKYIDHAAGIATHSIEEDLKESMTYCLRDDYELSLTVLFAQGKCLAILHNNSKYCTEFFNAHSNARPFPYWDNTDPDPKVSPANWRKRGKIWKDALPGAGVPDECGLHFKTKDPVMYLRDRSEKPKFEPAMLRAKDIATDYLCNIGCNALPKDLPLNHYFNVLSRVKRNPQRVNNIAKIIYPHLKDFASWREMARFPLQVTIKF